jgi:hypothetical protein
LLLSCEQIAIEPAEAVELYTRECSLNVTAKDLAVMGATLAGDGVNPLGGVMKSAGVSSSSVDPGARLVAAIAPELTIGFVRPSSLRSTAASEWNGRPVALTPKRRRAASAPRTSKIKANTNFDTLMIENGVSQSPLA